MNEQIERIKRMEALLNRVQAAVEDAERDRDGLLAVQEELRELEAYLNSDERRSDLAADEAGLLPAGLRRGVLSQDAIWNLLERSDEMLAEYSLTEDSPNGQSRSRNMARTDYDLLTKQARAIIEDVPHRIANLANLAALIWHSLDDINWAGFYLREGDRLILGPFQGNVACVEIPFGKGVCGTAVAEDATQLVPDVHLFKGHIACDSASRSEIVVPIHRDGTVIGVLDIDSPSPDRFTQEDRVGLEQLVAVMEESMR